MHIPAADAAVRFSNRVTDYVRARPGYPPELLSLLQRHCGLTTASVVADIGSGTGLLTTLLLEAGCRVFGVEPNREMREAGTQALQRFPAFVAVEGSAETTTLPDATIDVVTAAQAFHWFDRIRARAEFARILKPGGWVVLIWNDRRVDATPFLRGYEELLVTDCPDYLKVVHRNIDAPALAAFFAPQPFEAFVLDNHQQLDRDGFLARHRSSSFVPKDGPAAETHLARAMALFDAHARDGKIVIEYDVRIYVGKLTAV